MRSRPRQNTYVFLRRYPAERDEKSIKAYPSIVIFRPEKLEFVEPDHYYRFVSDTFLAASTASRTRLTGT